MINYSPGKNPLIMTLYNFVWGILGLTLGISINDIIIIMSDLFHIKILFVQNILQVTVCSLTLAFIQYFNNYFGWSWQNITPGLFFVSFFFGTQFKIINNLADQHLLKFY
jgi:hypothetical protein